MERRRLHGFDPGSPIFSTPELVPNIENFEENQDGAPGLPLPEDMRSHANLHQLGATRWEARGG